MLIGSFNDNKISSVTMTNENASFPKENMLSKYYRDKAKATATSTTITFSSVNNIRDICLFGLNAYVGTISATGGLVTTLTTQTITTNTSYAFIRVPQFETVTVQPGVTLTATGATSSIVSESIDLRNTNGQKDRYYKDLGAEYSGVSATIVLQGTAAQEVGLFWAGLLGNYGKATEFDRSSGYKFLSTQENYNDIYNLDERLFYVTQASRGLNSKSLLYGSIALSGMAFKEDMKIGTEHYGETNIKVVENG